MVFEKMPRKTFPGAPPGRENIDTQDLNVDVSATGAQAEWTDTEDAAAVIITALLKALSGGTSPAIQLNVQHSPDGVTVLDYGPLGSSLSAVPMTLSESYTTLHRFVRLAFVSSGTPTTATADLYITAKRR